MRTITALALILLSVICGMAGDVTYLATPYTPIISPMVTSRTAIHKGTRPVQPLTRTMMKAMKYRDKGMVSMMQLNPPQPSLTIR